MQLGKPNATSSLSPLLTNKARNARSLHYKIFSLLFYVLLLYTTPCAGSRSLCLSLSSQRERDNACQVVQVCVAQLYSEGPIVSHCFRRRGTS